jgi:hypothetical protein
MDEANARGPAPHRCSSTWPGLLLAFLALLPANASAISRCEVLSRAQAWVDDPNAWYSWDATYYDPTTGAGPYRPDCSGLVSAVWGLPPPGHTTYSLGGGPWDDGVSYVISASQLQPGDALNYPGDPNAGTGHVMLYVSGDFNSGWVEVMEEYNFGNTAERRWRSINPSIYLPIRYRDIVDGGPEVCDGVDNNCDGQADEGDVCGTGPNHCINIAGDFGFNCAGQLPGMYCANLAEPSEILQWADNYYCSARNIGLAWSSAGPLPGYDCTQVTEGSEPPETTWNDNFLCVLPGAPYFFAWSSAGPVGGDCVRWYESSDPHTWTDNFMCTARKDPNACLWRTAGFGFNCAGPIDGMDCVQLEMSEDPDSWSDNYFCSDFSIGLRWSAHGPIPGMKCTQVTESVEPAEQGWSDNYVCLPEAAPYELTWSPLGPLPSGGCVGWNEIADPETWGDNFMCARPTDPNACLWKEGGLAFNCAGAIDGMRCVNVSEPADAEGWADNYFCSDEDLGLQWSYEGPIDGMNCVQITEGSEGETEGWGDNYLCVSASAHVKLSWSSGGSPGTGTCIRWYEPADAAQTWTDNWLCVEREEICNGIDDDRDGLIDEDGVCPDAGTVTEDDGGTASSDGGSSAGSQDGSVAKGVPAVEVAGGCGCSSSQTRLSHCSRGCSRWLRAPITTASRWGISRKRPPRPSGRIRCSRGWAPTTTTSARRCGPSTSWRIRSTWRTRTTA